MRRRRAHPSPTLHLALILHSFRRHLIGTTTALGYNPPARTAGARDAILDLTDGKQKGRSLKAAIGIYGLTLAAVGAAWLARWLQDPLLGDRLPFVFFLFATLIAAWIGGLRPALVATVLGFVLARYFFVPPRFSFAGAVSPNFFGLVVYALVGLAIAFFGEAMQAARRRSRREEQLARREAEMVRITLASIGDAVLTTDAAGNVTLLNAVAQDLTGWSQADAAGRPLETVFNIVNEQTRQPAENPVQKVLKEGRVVGLANHTLLLTKDGAERPIDDSAAPIRDDRGNIVGVVLVFRDIAERRRQEAAQAERSRLTSLRADVAAALAANDDVQTALQQCTEALVRHLDVAFARVWTLDEAEAVLELQASAGMYTHLDGPHSRVRVGELKIGRIAQSRQPHLTNDVPHDPNVSDQEWARREGMVAFAGYPLGVEGRVVGVVAMFARRPLTEGVLTDLGPLAEGIAQYLDRKRAQERLRRNEERFRSLVAATSQVVWTTDPEGRIVEDSPSWRAFTGQTYEEWRGFGWLDAIHPDDRERTAQAWRQAVADRTLCQTLYRVRTADGTYRWTAVRAVPVLEPDGRIREWVGTNTDVTERKQAEERLQEGERRFKAVFNQQFQFMAILAPDGTVIEANDTCFEVTAVPRAEVLGRRFWETPWWNRLPAMQELWQRRIAQAVAGGGPVTGRAEYSLADGTVRLADIVITGLRDKAGRVESLIVEGRDITEQERAQAALRESERLLRFVMDSLPQKIFTTRPDGSVDYLNPIWMEFTGLSFDEIRDWGWTKFIHPDDLEENVRAWRHSVSTGEPFQFEHRFRRADSEYRWHISRAEAMRDAEGRIVMWIGSNTDIHDVKQAHEQALRRSEQVRRLAEVATRLNLAADLASVTGVVTEEARNLIGAHQSVTSFTTDHDWGQAINAVSLSDKYAQWRSYDKKPDGSGIYSLVCRMNRPMRMTQAELEAHPAWKRFGAEAESHPPMRGWLAAPLVGRDGRNIGLIQLSDKYEGEFTQDDEGVLVQLAQMASVAIENARLVEDLREADRRKDEFLATLAHELRNPLAPLRNGLQLMRLAGRQEGTLEQARTMMERQLNQLVRLVDDLMDVSRITRGKLKLRKERVQLAAVVQQAVETSRPAVEQAGLELAISLPPDPVTVDADVTRLSQVFSNLLNNAAKFTDRGGHVWLAIERRGGEAVVSVRDDGIGIPPAMLTRVFEMFTQVDRSLERSQGGLGIGLTLVRRLVEMHGGGVEARSGGPGTGSEFVVRLPVVPAALDGAQPPEDAGAVPPASRRRVLVVDDNRDAATSLALMLEIMGNQTRTAHDGLEALDAAAAFLPDVVLLDIGMPRLNGYDAARRFRGEPWGRDLVLVALTGWSQDEDRRRSLEAGFDFHMVKPVDPAALAELLAGLEARGD